MEREEKKKKDIVIDKYREKQVEHQRERWGERKIERKTLEKEEESEMNIDTERRGVGEKNGSNC